MEVLARKENTVFVQRKYLKGDLVWVNLDGSSGSEQNGVRPSVIISNDTGNKFAPIVTVAILTSKINKAKLPTHVEISSKKYNLQYDSVLLAEQIRTLDKVARIGDYIGHLDAVDMNAMNRSLMISLGLEIPVARTNNKVMNG